MAQRTTAPAPVTQNLADIAAEIDGAMSFGELIAALDRLERHYRDASGKIAAAAESVRIRCKQTSGWPLGLNKEIEARHWRKLLQEVAANNDDSADAAKALRWRVEQALAESKAKKSRKGFDTQR